MASLPSPDAVQEKKKAKYREAQHGKIYGTLTPGSEIDISAWGGTYFELDVENLGLEKVSLEGLVSLWEKYKDEWTKQCEMLGVELDPFMIFKYYHIQRKVFSVLGKSIENVGARNERLYASGNHIKLSEMRDSAMCSEYAVLAAYIAQEIGEPVKLIIGSVLVGEDEWREAHAYVWVESDNVILDAVQAQQAGDWPALMVPENGKTLLDMEAGFDIRAKKLGSEFTAVYGLEAGGFGSKIKDQNSQ